MALWLAMSGKEYHETWTALTIALGAMLVFWAQRSRLVPTLIPPDSKAKRRPRPRPMAESAPQPLRHPEHAPRVEDPKPEPRPPIALPDDD